MKFPGGDRLRRIKDSLFPALADPQVEPEKDAAAIELELAAKRHNQTIETYKMRLDCAERLRPYVGRLLLVNNFKTFPREEHAARVSQAVLTEAGFAEGMPLGISALLSYERSERNHTELLETVDALKTSLEGSVGRRVFSLVPQYDSHARWLVSLARAAEDTAKDCNLPPQEIGCIAVVSALNMHRQADIPWMPEPGGVFKLTGISEEAHFDWQIVSVNPEDEARVAAWEEMQRLRRDPGDFQ